jgi:lactoylglutathione lyase
MLSLIVLRTAKLDAALAFYRALGLEFVSEQHGNGPIHYSTQIDKTVLEIYPGKEGSAPPRLQAGATMLGFQVKSMDETLVSLQSFGIEIITPAKDSPWGRRAVVVDPDGRAVEISQPPAVE